VRRRYFKILKIIHLFLSKHKREIEISKPFLSNRRRNIILAYFQSERFFLLTKPKKVRTKNEERTQNQKPPSSKPCIFQLIFTPLLLHLLPLLIFLFFFLFFVLFFFLLSLEHF